jgi:hypothetical protein
MLPQQQRAEAGVPIPLERHMTPSLQPPRRRAPIHPPTRTSSGRAVFDRSVLIGEDRFDGDAAAPIGNRKNV